MNSAMLLSAGGLTGFDGSLVSTSLVLVFGLLVVLCLIIMLEGKLFDSLNKKRQDAARAELDRSVSAAAPAPAARKAAPAPAPAVEAGIPGEVIAAIAAAVCCLEGGSVTVRSVRRLPQPGASRRGAWGQAGVVQNTQPFVF